MRCWVGVHSIRREMQRRDRSEFWLTPKKGSVVNMYFKMREEPGLMWAEEQRQVHTDGLHLMQNLYLNKT